jgi:hypothetical protein
MALYWGGRRVRSVLVNGAFVLACTTCSKDAPTSSPKQKPATLPAHYIKLENTQSGSSGWRGAYNDWASEKDLSLWASPYHAQVGDSLDVFVHAPAGPVTLELYRLGWYGGLGSRLMLRFTDVAAGAQQVCSAPVPGPVVCKWTRTMQIGTSAEWLSGVYLLKVIDANKRESYYPIVLRDTRPANFVVVVPQFTWQAYNRFGGSSLYTADPTSPSGAGRYVSFERPFAPAQGLSLLWEVIPAVHWLEAAGYDVTYTSDADLASATWSGTGSARGLIFPAHSEYWTWAMRDRVESLRDAGTHLVFLSGNNAYWNIRLSSGATGRPSTVITCWKGSDPDARQQQEFTTQFRLSPLNRPENGLYGIMYDYVTGPKSKPLVVSDSAVGPEAREFLRAAGLTEGDTLANLVGGEGDRIFPNGFTPPNLQILFRSPYDPSLGQRAGVFHTTFFISSQGAGVFAGGNNQFSYGLDVDPRRPGSNARLRAVMAAVLDWMTTH